MTSAFGLFKKPTKKNLVEEEPEITEEEKKAIEKKRQLRQFKEQLEDLIKKYMESIDDKDKDPDVD